MICCLPFSPGYAWVSRTDWMISRILRSSRLPSNALGGRSRARTSCWVIVEPPRGRPLIVSTVAETKSGEVEARVVPEILVLDRGRRVEDLRRQLGEGDDLALPLAEFGELDRAGPIGHDRLLIEGEVGQRGLRVRQAVGVVGVGGGDPEQSERSGGQEDDEEDDRERDRGPLEGGRSARPLADAQTTMSLAPRQSRLHIGAHDSMRGCSVGLPRDLTPRRLGFRACDGGRDGGSCRAARGRPAGTPRRVALAGPVPRRDARSRRAVVDRPPDRRLQRVRPVGALAPRRPPRADHGARPPPAAGRQAGRARRRRHGDDRRPVGDVRRAEPARSRRRSRRTSPGSAPSSSASSPSTARTRRSWSTTSTG